MVRTPAQAVAGIAVGRIKTRLLLAAGIPKPKRGCPDRAALDRLELMRTAGIVLNIADPVQATYFQVQYILNALKVADPGHLVSALAIEASIRVTGGRRHTDEAERFLRAARELAGDNPNALGFVQLCSEYVGYLLGDIRRCAADGERAVNFLREKCTGVAWEITAGHVMLFWALCWSGEVERVRELLPQLLKEGAARGDINVEVSLRLLSYIHYAYLSADQPEACLQESQQGLERWSKKGYHLQHYGALFTRVETYLYMGDYRRAREELLSHWQTMSRSLILRWQILRVMAWFLRGRTALACWLDDRPDRSLYREVENCCRSLRRIDSPWSSAIVAALTGGIAVGEGRRDDAVRQLIRAAVEFQQISLNGYAASARYLAGALMANDEGRRLTEEATAFFQSQHVQNHSSFRRMLLPGNWIADTGVK